MRERTPCQINRLKIDHKNVTLNPMFTNFSFGPTYRRQNNISLEDDEYSDRINKLFINKIFHRIGTSLTPQLNVQSIDFLDGMPLAERYT